MKSIVHRIPGGWYGNDPYEYNGKMIGNVAVDPRYVHHAIKWLSRRAHIVETSVKDEANGHAIMLRYELR